MRRRRFRTVAAGRFKSSQFDGVCPSWPSKQPLRSVSERARFHHPDDIIKGAFELAEDVGIDNLACAARKHLGVGVTSIYWYSARRTISQRDDGPRAAPYVSATPYVEARDGASVGQSRAPRCERRSGQHRFCAT